MIKPADIDKLYETMSKDMKISRFKGEDIPSFRNRVLYSGLGKWIMQLFADRDFEEDDSNQVSKSHVTISALDIIDSFQKISANALGFFEDKDKAKKAVNEIEDIYLNLGYINSGTYTFKYPNKRARVHMGSRSLVVDLDTTMTRYCGLGIYSNSKDGDTQLEDFFVIKDSALDCFKKMAKSMKYEKADLSHGKNEIYNIEQNRWDFYSEKSAKKYEYSIVRVDDGLNHKIIRTVGEELYEANLPAIYSHPGDDDLNFKREIWRLILGLCAYNNRPAAAIIDKYCDKGIKISFGGYVLPFNEYSIFKCIAWPLHTALDINDFVAGEEMIDAIKIILKHLSIEILEEER